MIKREIRLLGIDDAPFKKEEKGKNVLVVGALFRGGQWLDGILSTKVRIDGRNATKKLIKMINQCKFKPQLKAIMLDGIALGGFNIVDIQKLWRATGIPVMVIVRRKPNLRLIKKTLRSLGMEWKFSIIERSGPVKKIDNIYIQTAGIEFKKAKEIVKVSCTRSFIPEPIRIAHMIASGIVEGESRGRA